jgi:hypothetical protein
LVVVLAASVGGCASSDPVIHLAGVQVRERTGEGVVLAITLEADNATSRALPLREVSYVVYLDGTKVFEGERSAEATIRRYGSQRVVLPAVVVPASGVEGRRRCRVTGQMTYVVPGVLAEALFDADVVRPSVSFDVEDGVDLDVAP